MNLKNIEFRGKCGGRWRYGSFAEGDIVDKATFVHREVVLGTVGMFTGLIDKYDIKIFEGDIVCDGALRYVVVWDECTAAFKLRHRYTYTPLDKRLSATYTVIGNIYDNAELLDGICDINEL